MNNIHSLFDSQEILDNKIKQEHKLENENLVDRKILALLVELGELANETRCFKYWSLKSPSEKEVILEEYVDGVHFILSIGIDLQFEDVQVQWGGKNNALTDQFLTVYQVISDLLQKQTKENYTILFNEYFILGNMLGFRQDDIVQAYHKKNQINHERQENGY